MSTSTGKQSRRDELFGQGLKKCCDCHAVKALSEFSRIERNCHMGVSAYASACKPCRNIRSQNRRAANPQREREMARAAHVARTYGLTAEQYNAIHVAQKGCCAICLRHATELKKGIGVDHDHDTGKVRGLLCTECNAAIGMLGDDPALVAAALAYLQRTN